MKGLEAYSLPKISREWKDSTPYELGLSQVIFYKVLEVIQRTRVIMTSGESRTFIRDMEKAAAEIHKMIVTVYKNYVRSVYRPIPHETVLNICEQALSQVDFESRRWIMEPTLDSYRRLIEDIDMLLKLAESIMKDFTPDEMPYAIEDVFLKADEWIDLRQLLYVIWTADISRHYEETLAIIMEHSPNACPTVWRTTLQWERLMFSVEREWVARAILSKPIPIFLEGDNELLTL